MSGDNNITAVPNVEQDKNIAILETLRRNLDTIIATNKIIAKIRFEHYKACIEAGFTPEQALHLCHSK